MQVIILVPNNNIKGPVEAWSCVFTVCDSPHCFEIRAMENTLLQEHTEEMSIFLILRLEKKNRHLKQKENSSCLLQLVLMERISVEISTVSYSF